MSEKLQDVTINYLVQLGMEDSWGFQNTYSESRKANFREFATNDYYAFDNPNLIDNLNKSLVNITPQLLIDMVDYYYNLAYIFADTPIAQNYHVIDNRYWGNIEFVPKRGSQIARFDGSIVGDDLVKFLVNDGWNTTVVKVSTISKTYKFIGRRL